MIKEFVVISTSSKQLLATWTVSGGIYKKVTVILNGQRMFFDSLTREEHRTIMKRMEEAYLRVQKDTCNSFLKK